MVKAVVQIARLVTIQMVTIPRVLLVVLAPTVIKCFNRRMCRAKHARRAGTRGQRRVKLERLQQMRGRQEKPSPRCYFEYELYGVCCQYKIGS